MSFWEDLTGAFTGGGSASEAEEALEGALDYAKQVAGPYVWAGKTYYPYALQRQKRILKSNWLAPMRGALEQELTRARSALARSGLEESGIGRAQEQAIASNWADQLARLSIEAKRNKLAGYADLAGLTSGTALRAAGLPLEAYQALAQGRLARSETLTRYYNELNDYLKALLFAALAGAGASAAV